MEKSQREYYLNEQVKAIQKELGDGEDGADMEELEKKILAAKMPKEARKKADAELKKLKLMSPMSAEATVVRNYIDTLVNLPWSKKTKIKHDLKNAEDVLNEDHYGLEKVKDRILEYLAVQQRVDKVKAPILCLVGPPGVGKTSLGQSVARATGRKFVRMALGGVRDEAEIRGHRRTYIGSMPGKVLQSLTKVGTRNPLFLLDEIDKLGMDFRGDPSSACWKCWTPSRTTPSATTTSRTRSWKSPSRDPRRDPLLHAGSRRAFARARDVQDLPQGGQGHPAQDLRRQGCRDRGQPQRLPGRAQVRLRPCREEEPGRPGGRSGMDGSRRRPAHHRSHGHAGQGQHHPHRLAGRRDEGVRRGRAHGGALTRSPPGHQGRGFREARCARPRARWRHAQGRASAGAAMTTAFVSALTGIPVRADVAMTGEITLRGEVTAIGGLKEKLLAAHRGGIKTVMIPEENVKDLQDIPENVKNQLEIVPVRWIERVLEVALESAPTPLPDEEVPVAAAKAEEGAAKTTVVPH
ncbi:hypothetical protein Lal_00013059 [Lupinus albus]|nr:hypothetical protein Lal_00013059 [Lupinus albus]